MSDDEPKPNGSMLAILSTTPVHANPRATNDRYIFRDLPGRKWSGQPDSNRRPPLPQSGALPDCAMSRKVSPCNEIQGEQVRTSSNVEIRGARRVQVLSYVIVRMYLQCIRFTFCRGLICYKFTFGIFYSYGFGDTVAPFR